MDQSQIYGQTGEVNYPDGVVPVARMDRQGGQMVSNLHGRYYEQTRSGRVFGFGIGNTVLAAVNAIATGLTATAKPVIGLYNPAGSGKNLVVLKTTIIHTLLANTAVNTGGFSWVVSAAGQSAVSTGSTPWNRFSLAQSGSVAKAFAVSTALTGLSGSLTDTGIPCEVSNFTAAGAGTAISLFAPPNPELTEGSWIIPPGFVLGVMNLVSTTTVQVAAGIMWEECPI